MSTARFSPCAAVHAGVIYVTGGANSANSSADDAENGATADLDSAEMYDVKKGRGWIAMPNMNRKRRHHACAVLGGNGGGGDGTRLVVAGGSGVFDAVQTSVEMLDLGSDDGGWIEMAVGLAKPRCCWPQMGLLGGNLVIMGGEEEAGDSLETWDGQQWAQSEVKTPQKREMRSIQK